MHRGGIAAILVQPTSLQCEEGGDTCNQGECIRDDEHDFRVTLPEERGQRHHKDEPVKASMRVLSSD